MKIILCLFILIPALALSQQKDYKNFDRAVKYNVDGKIDKAIKYAKKSLEKSPDWIQPQLLLASIYSKSNQIELAVDYLLKVSKFNKSNYEKCLEQIIELYFFNGFYSKALNYSEKLISFINEQGRTNDHITKYISNCKFAIDAKKNPVLFNPVKFNNINTNFAEFVNFISIDGEKLFFTRRIEYHHLFSNQ